MYSLSPTVKTGASINPAVHVLMAIIVLVLLLLLHQTCSAKDTNRGDCVLSSCGNIPNISFPFRLEHHPPNCGNPNYTLSCKDNHTVLYLFSVEYYVQEINYASQTIRVVDSGIQKGNYSNTPSPYSVLWENTPYYLYGDEVEGGGTMALLKCEKRVNLPWYLNKSNCFGHREYAASNSSSSGFRYVIYNQTIHAGDVEDLCQVGHIFFTSSPSRNLLPDDPGSISCSDLHNLLLYGLELNWSLPDYSCGFCGIFEFGKERSYCCRRHSGILGMPYRVYGVIRGILSDLYWTIEEKVRHTALGGRIDYRISKYIDGYYNTGATVPLIIIIIDLGVCHGAIIILGIPFVVAFLIYKWRRRHLSAFDIIEEFLQNNNNLMPIRYSYSEVRKITKKFKDKLGEGGYGTVFKGTLRSGRLVAVKMLGKSKANGQEFISEVATIGRIHHINVVQLIGFCVEGSKRALIYEFMPNGSLNKYIISEEGSILLSYKKMHNIALGIARGIEYLHQGCEMQILHFDIKPHNILLDEHLTPKVSDFGLAKLYPMNGNTISLTAVRGTLGYMAPELCYKNIGSISYKADVYSFGMLLMDMMGRRRNLNVFADQSSKYFPNCVYEEVQDENDIEIENATEEEKKIAKEIIIVALWCIQMKPSDRPSMNKVLEMLEGDIESLEIPPKPFLTSPERQLEDIEDNSNPTFSTIQSSQYTLSSSIQK